MKRNEINGRGFHRLWRWEMALHHISLFLSRWRTAKKRRYIWYQLGFFWRPFAWWSGGAGRSGDSIRDSPTAHFKIGFFKDFCGSLEAGEGFEELLSVGDSLCILLPVLMTRSVEQFEGLLEMFDGWSCGDSPEIQAHKFNCSIYQLTEILQRCLEMADLLLHSLSDRKSDLKSLNALS